MKCIGFDCKMIFGVSVLLDIALHTCGECRNEENLSRFLVSVRKGYKFTPILDKPYSQKERSYEMRKKSFQ